MSVPNAMYYIKMTLNILASFQAISPGFVETEMEGIARKSQEEGAKFHAGIGVGDVCPSVHITTLTTTFTITTTTSTTTSTTTVSVMGI